MSYNGALRTALCRVTRLVIPHLHTKGPGHYARGRRQGLCGCRAGEEGEGYAPDGVEAAG